MRKKWSYLLIVLVVCCLSCATVVPKKLEQEPVKMTFSPKAEYRRLLAEKQEGSIRFRIFLCGELRDFDQEFFLWYWFSCTVENVGEEKIVVRPPMPRGAVVMDLTIDDGKTVSLFLYSGVICYLDPVELMPGSGIVVDKIAPWLLEWGPLGIFEKPREYVLEYRYTYHYDPWGPESERSYKSLKGTTSGRSFFPEWVDHVCPCFDVEFPVVTIYQQGEKFIPERFGIYIIDVEE